MPVVINEFEAVAEAPPAKSGESGAGEAKRKIQPADLRWPLHMLGARRARVRAH
jgi:hypothetical protein